MVYNIIDVLEYLNKTARNFHVDNVIRVDRYNVCITNQGVYSVIYVIHSINNTLNVAWIHDGKLTTYAFYGENAMKSFAKKLLLDMKVSIEQTKEIIGLESSDDLLTMIQGG